MNRKNILLCSVKMSRPNKPHGRDLEWRTLQLFCAQIREEFADPLHRALFEEILHCARRKMSATELRRWLPGEMTRRGWPDLDFADLFCEELSALTRGQFLESVRALRASNKISTLSKSASDSLSE
jgi:hypothetical protein